MRAPPALPAVTFTYAVLALSAAALGGCSRTDTAEPRFAEGTHMATVAKASPPSQPPPISAPTAFEAPDELQGGSRPRLSRTLRLGVDTSTYESVRAGAPSQQGGSGVTVIVNNNVSQQQTAISSGGFGGYRGYGGGYGYNNAGNTGGYSGSRHFGTQPSSTPTPQPQGYSNVPRVGGDWAPARNYGPPAMR